MSVMGSIGSWEEKLLCKIFLDPHRDCCKILDGLKILMENGKKHPGLKSFMSS